MVANYGVGVLGFGCILGSSRIDFAQWSPSGTQIAVASDDDKLRFICAEHGLISSTICHNSRLLRIAWSPLGLFVATASDDRCVRLCSPNTECARPVLSEIWHDSAVVALAWSPAGQQLATATEGGILQVFEPIHGRLEAKHDFLAPIADLAWGA